MTQIPANELSIAASLLQDLQWLALEVERGEDRPASLARQQRAAMILFSSLDEPSRAPSVAALLEDHDIDLNLVLAWYSAGTERAHDWSARLTYLQRAARVLQTSVEHAVQDMSAETRDQLQRNLERRRTSLGAWAYAAD